MVNKKRRVWCWLQIRWKSCKKSHKKIINEKVTEKLKFCIYYQAQRFWAYDFFWVIFFTLFFNERKVSINIYITFFAYINTVWWLYSQIQTKWLKITKNLFYKCFFPVWEAPFCQKIQNSCTLFVQCVQYLLFSYLSINCRSWLGYEMALRLHGSPEVPKTVPQFCMLF